MLKDKSVRSAVCVLTTLFVVGLFLSSSAQAAKVTVGKAVHHDTSKPMTNMKVVKVNPTGKNRQVPLRAKPGLGRFPDLAESDGGLQPQLSTATQLAPTPGPALSVPGLSEQDNRDTVGYSVVPPDINGDIGLDDAGNRIFIQYINSIWGVFDVNGNLVNGPFRGNTFWTGFGGVCETNNDGDPIVLYDDQAGQWLFSQFSINQGIQCVAISTTSDPLGPYHRYAFIVTPGGANDYPKLGVWDDGTTGSTGQSAYTFTLRDFGGAGGSFSVSAGVMDRDAMLVGDPAQFIKFINPCTNNDCIEGQLPPHLAGPVPPAGTCPTFWTAVDSAFDDSPHANDGYRNHTLCADWTTPGNSSYVEGPLVVAGSNFDRFLGDITPVQSGERLDSLSHFTMYRAQYRWFGDSGRVVLNSTVDAGNNRAGIRWAETRSTDGDTGWFLQQDGTFAPADGLERWMGSIAQDGDGNIALGYTAAGSNLFPSVRYTTRSAGDAAGTMAGGEASCHEGSGAQTASSGRWGDYSSMSIDPTDDCTFWYTQEYYQTTGSYDFNTRICSFKLDGCGGPPPACTNNADCDNGRFCDGVETCNTGTGICEAGTAPDCDNGLFCDGIESCNETTDSCDAGTPPSPDDGVGCTDDTCNEDTDSFDHTPIDAACDNGIFCDGTETCDLSLDCQAGSAQCTGDGETCDEGGDQCVTSQCNNNGVCEFGEDCNNCANDCLSGTIPGASCGNDLCEAGDGETAANCSADCNGRLTGRPSSRFSCGLTGQYAVGCSDSRCTTSGYACTESPVEPGAFCCGDAVCEGDESSASCELDCGAGPVCGNNVIETGETCDGLDLGGATCNSQGFDGGTLACMSDCGDFNTASCTGSVCVPAGKEKGKRCSDGIDNDCDGLIDGDDPEC